MTTGKNKDQLVHEIGSRIIRDIGSRQINWAQLVMVGKIENDNPEMTGFAYLTDGEHEPVAPKDFDILYRLVDLRDAMAASDRKAPWVTCLIRIDRKTNEIDFDFEYKEADRWAITFQNRKERAEEFRPKKK